MYKRQLLDSVLGGGWSGFVVPIVFFGELIVTGGYFLLFFPVHIARYEGRAAGNRIRIRAFVNLTALQPAALNQFNCLLYTSRCV